MISKHVSRNSKDNYGRLAEYLAAAKEVGEKLEELWIVNCNAADSSEDLDLAILEIEATQNLNSRVKGDKTYHMIVSFRDQKPTSESLRDIEESFAKALGFEDHQRVVATHKNTDNHHMHVAYNMINPESLKIHHPKWDYRERDRVCREMEKKYALSIDKGQEAQKQLDKPSPKSRDYEATTWEQSFDGYVRENKKELKEIYDRSNSWKDLHKGFADYDLRIKKRGNGLVITTKDRKTGIKASSIDRAFSKASMEKKFGSFVAPEKNPTKTKPFKRYGKKPITFHPKQVAAWNRYIGKKRSKDSLALKVYKNWREFLAAEALSDPLAMAIMVYHKQLLKLPDKMVAELKNSPKSINNKNMGRLL